MVFGMISPKRRTSSESTTMATDRLCVGISLAKRSAAVADVATLIKVFPNRMVESNSRGRCNRLTMSCERRDLSCARRRRSMRFKQKRAVSVAEKQPEQTSKTARSDSSSNVLNEGASNRISKVKPVAVQKQLFSLHQPRAGLP